MLLALHMTHGRMAPVKEKGGLQSTSSSFTGGISAVMLLFNVLDLDLMHEGDLMALSCSFG